MNEKKRIKFQNELISRQLEQVESLKSQISKLELELQKKDDIINSVANLKDELIKDISEVKKYKDEYKKLIGELRKMKEILNQTAYKGKWRLVKFLIK